LRWPVQHEVFVSGRVECCRYIVSPEVAGTKQEGLLANA
jgi:hypothetical protein